MSEYVLAGTRPDDVFMGLPLDVRLPLGMELGLMATVLSIVSQASDYIGVRYQGNGTSSDGDK